MSDAAAAGAARAQAVQRVQQERSSLREQIRANVATRLTQLKAQRQHHRALVRSLSKQIKLLEKKRARMLQTASGLSRDDMVMLIAAPAPAPALAEEDDP